MKEEIRQKLEEAGIVQPKENKPMPEQPGMTFTLDMLQQLVATAVATAIQETKKLPADEQEALDEKKRRTAESRVSRVKEAVQDDRLRRSTQFHCTHIKYAEGVFKQEHAFRGQVNNDNCCRAICIRCNKLFPPFKVTEENMKSGMSLQNVKMLTANALYEAHKRSFPDCKECANGSCAARDIREAKQGHLDPEPIILPSGKVKAAELAAV